MQTTRIKQNLITAQYNLSFDSSDSTSTTIELFDETPPEAEIYFDSNTQKLEIKGTDNTTVNPEVSVISENKKQTIYQIQDEADNTTKLYFDKSKQEGEEIKTELKAIQYNDGEVIDLPKTELKYEWSVDKTIFEKYPNIVGDFDMLEWSKDSRYFWGNISDGAYVNAYFRIDTQDWKYDIFEAPDGAMGGSHLNINTGYLPIQPGQVWTGDYQLTQELKEQYRKEGKKSQLYLYNLFTKEKILITSTADDPLWWFKPNWLSDAELQYELPTGEKKIYKIK